jgi:M6 family metalloprotease-like protein
MSAGPAPARSGVLLILFSFVVLSGFTQPEAWVPPERNPRFVVYDLPPDEIVARLGIPYEEMLERRGFVGTRAPSDTGVVLVLLCQWEDDPADTLAHPRADYETLLFSESVLDPGSMREYFLEVSYGDYWIEGDVVGWLTEPTYRPNLWFTDFLEQADDIVDYSDYDRDGDGYTDAVWIFHAGPGQEETHNPNHIWSYAVYGLNYMTDDGVIVDRYSCNPEEHADGSIITIRVPAHEATHVLGMPDLYDYDAKLDTTTYFTPNDANDHPLVDWCIMGYGGYNIMNYGTNQPCPQHHCAWMKKELGWMSTTQLTTDAHDIPVPEAQTNPIAYQILRSGSSGREYFLIENRNTQGSARFDRLDSDFSAYCPWFTSGRNPKDAGLVIYHVDESIPSNTGYSRYMVTVEDAGYDPGNPWDGVSEYSEWWYPYEFRIGTAYAAEDDQISFTPISSPNSDWYTGASGIWITNISESDSVMTFDLGFGNAWPAITDHVPAVLETTLTAGASHLFSVVAVDEDGDPTLFEWRLNSTLVQSSGDSTYNHVAGLAGTIDTLEVVATDGALADTLAWLLENQPGTSVAAVPPGADQVFLAAGPVPFASAVTIRCSLPRTGPVHLAVYDLAGRLVATLAEGVHPAGSLVRRWNGSRDTGEDVAAGIYFVRVVAGESSLTRRVVRLR